MKTPTQKQALCWLSLLSFSTWALPLQAQPTMKMPMAKKSTAHAGHSASPFTKEMMQSMRAMDKNMMSAPMTGNPDRDFAAMMIPHHQGAIDMAKIQLRYGKDPVLRRLAQKIVATQNDEISVMKQRLATLKPATAAKKPMPKMAPMEHGAMHGKQSHAG